MTETKGNFGIIVSGGPAPGINSVIASVVYTANDYGYKVLGFKDGLAGMVKDGSKTAITITPEDATRFHKNGGSVLRTIRFNPFETPDSTERMLNAIRENNIDKLIMIGGDGTAYVALQIAKHYPGIRIAHVPKTIDNDLILPNEYPSFGFETARAEGTKLMRTLITESRTTVRWFIVKTMGRNAGFLALGLGIASGASITLIPEQFKQGITPSDVADEIMPTIIKRIKNNRNYGTVILAEGIVDKFDQSKVPEIRDIPRDPVGRLVLGDVDLEGMVLREVNKRVKEQKLPIRLTAENLGYVLRCQDPVPFDLEYTKFLGYGAVKFLMEGKSNFMVVRDFDKINYVSLESMLTEDGTRMRSRHVNLDSDLYKVARNFMIR